MSDFRRSTGMQLRDGGLVYDDFYVAPPGTFGHPDIHPGQRAPREGWFERGREALSFGSDTSFHNLAMRFRRLMSW
jgi:hypothetical protein